VQRYRDRPNFEEKSVCTHNFFTPFRATIMDTDSLGAKAVTFEEAIPGKASRPSQIILMSKGNLIQLQRQLKNVVKGDFEFRSTRNGTTVITIGMVDFEAVKSHFSNNNLSYYSIFPKSQKSIKAVIRHLPPSTPAEDIFDGLVALVFDVKQMTTTRRSPSEGITTRNLPLFLITLPRMSSLCHISIRVEAYRAQSGLMHCYKCQVWPCLDKMQATSPLFMVRGRPPV
jgi:hypothetical protein